MVKSCRSVFLAVLVWSACPSLGQVVLTPEDADGLYRTGENVIWTARYFDPVNFAPRIKATTLVSFGLFDGTSPPTGVMAAFNLIAGPKELLPLHSDHGGPGQQSRNVRREEWLSALVKGEPVILKK